MPRIRHGRCLREGRRPPPSRSRGRGGGRRLPAPRPRPLRTPSRPAAEPSRRIGQQRPDPGAERILPPAAASPPSGGRGSRRTGRPPPTTRRTGRPGLVDSGGPRSRGGLGRRSGGWRDETPFPRRAALPPDGSSSASPGLPVGVARSPRRQRPRRARGGRGRRILDRASRRRVRDAPDRPNGGDASPTAVARPWPSGRPKPRPLGGRRPRMLLARERTPIGRSVPEEDPAVTRGRRRRTRRRGRARSRPSPSGRRAPPPRPPSGRAGW